jgi:hypothetical protein
VPCAGVPEGIIEMAGAIPLARSHTPCLLPSLARFACSVKVFPLKLHVRSAHHLHTFTPNTVHKATVQLFCLFATFQRVWQLCTHSMHACSLRCTCSLRTSASRDDLQTRLSLYMPPLIKDVAAFISSFLWIRLFKAYCIGWHWINGNLEDLR